MTHLFKLKKDGKVVGYVKFAHGHIFFDNGHSVWPEIDICKQITYDSIHPFVCQDKNGQDVFEDDKVKLYGFEGVIKKDNLRVCIVDKNSEKIHLPAKYHWKHIELIERKKNARTAANNRF